MNSLKVVKGRSYDQCVRLIEIELTFGRTFEDGIYNWVPVSKLDRYYYQVFKEYFK